MKLDRDGVRIAVHDVTDDEVYYQFFPKGVDEQGFLENLYRMPRKEFEASIKESDLVKTHGG